MSGYPLLFSPLVVNRLKLRNRIVMPAMHLHYTPDGRVNDKLAAFYRERALGGAGLIIVGGCAINDLAGGPHFVSIKSDGDIPGLSRLAETVHAHGAAMGAQLYMAGAYANSKSIGAQAVSSSAHVSGYTRQEAREMTLDEIGRTQDDFAAAAVRAKEAGLDMVEVLASAGYLVCQFLSPKINRRTDIYGGSLDNRMRFGLETIQKVRRAVGPDFCVGVRIAGHDFVPGSHTDTEAALFAAACEEAGADLINVTGGWHESRAPQITGDLPAAGFSYLARGVRRAVQGVPVACSNRIHHPDMAEDILTRGDADLVCMGRPLLADPELPRKARNGRPELIRQCVACNQGCFDAVIASAPVSCTVNPRAGLEGTESQAGRVETPARVVVIGGGVAGCQAAMTLAGQGHEVILLEAEQRLGGQVAWYPQPTAKPDFSSIPRWQEATLKALAVDVRLGIKADADYVAELEPDEVILATGGRPGRPPIPGVDSGDVVSAWDVLKGDVRPRGPVVVIGGGAVGLETALFLARQGALTPEQVYYLTLYKGEDAAGLARLVTEGSLDVTVLELLPKVGQGIGHSTRWIVMSLIRKFGVKVRTKAQVLAIEPGGVRFVADGREKYLPAGTVVLAAGFEPVTELAGSLRGKGFSVHPVGDAAGAGTVLAAIAQGHETGRRIV